MNERCRDIIPSHSFVFWKFAFWKQCNEVALSTLISAESVCSPSGSRANWHTSCSSCVPYPLFRWCRAILMEMCASFGWLWSKRTVPIASSLTSPMRISECCGSMCERNQLLCSFHGMMRESFDIMRVMVSFRQNQSSGLSCSVAFRSFMIQ